MCHTPIVIGGLDITRAPFSAGRRWKNSEKTAFAWLIHSIGRNTRPVAATSGFWSSPGLPPLGDALGIVPAHRHGQRNGRQVWCFFIVFLSACKPCRPPGQYSANTRPMAASSGFRGSHELPPSGDESGIVPAHQLGRQTGSDGGAFDRHRQFCHQR